MMTIDAMEKLIQNEDAENLPFHRPNGRVVSFPRSGRTWVRHMTSYVVWKISKKRKRGLAYFKHDGARIQSPRTFRRHYRKDKKPTYKGLDVLLLVRDPRDVTISGWFYLARRLQAPKFKKMSLSTYFRGHTGLTGCVGWMNKWSQEKSVPRSFRLAYYEKFLVDPALELWNLLRFFNVHVDLDLCVEASETFSFCRMREHELKFGIAELSSKLGRQVEKHPDNMAVRAGKAGGFVDYLSQEDREWGDRYLEEHLDPFYEEYSWSNQEEKNTS